MFSSVIAIKELNALIFKFLKHTFLHCTFMFSTFKRHYFQDIHHTNTLKHLPLGQARDYYSLYKGLKD